MRADWLYRYALDRVNGRFVSGWCFHRFHRTRPVSVTITGNGKVLGSVINDRFRPDLKEQNLHPTGVCGFDLSFPADFNPRRCRTLSVFFDGSAKPAQTIACRDIPFPEPVPGTRVFFMHLPKTAGTSFNALARECFAAENYRVHLERLPEAEQAAAIRSCGYVAGHLPWRTIRTFEGLEPFNFYALLRDPYAHLHSHLNYVKGVFTQAGQEAYYRFRHNDTIRDLGRRLSGIDFAGREGARSFVAGLEGFERDFFDNMQTRYFLDYRPERVSSDHVPEARKNLERFRLVGLTEAYDAFRERFCRQIGVALPPQPVKSNTAQNYRLFDTSDPAMREAFRPLVEIDLQLYDLVRQRFSW